MKSEEIKNKTKEATDYLVQSLEAGHSEVLTEYLGAMGKFHTYSFGNIEVRQQREPSRQQMMPGLRCLLLCNFGASHCARRQPSCIGCTPTSIAFSISALLVRLASRSRPRMRT